MKQSILIFDRIYSNAVAEFVFDQSSAHGAFAKNALNAKEMNVRSGRKQRKMHDTFIPMDNPNPECCGMPQAMVFPLDLPPTHPDFKLCGQPKGMLCILEERGLISVLQAANGGKAVGECQTCKLSREGQERMLREMQVAMAEGGDEPVENVFDIVQASLCTDCCMWKMIANQQDFKDEKPLIQLIIEEARYKCWFLPKFHCKLNPIEMYWGWVKARECSDGNHATEIFGD